MTTPDLSIIIVNWNVRDLLAACLRSLESQRAQLAMQVIVVDSHSADDSVAMVQRDFPWVELIVCMENVGFPRGNNLGLARANGRYILLLNPDTEVMGDALVTMVAYAEAHTGVGALGPQLLNPDGSVQSSRRRFPTWATALFESTWLEPFAPASILGHYYVQDVADGETAVVDWVTGACLLVRREVVAQVGGLDEAYFMYSEELDWCRRIKMAGWQVIYLPTAQVIHHVGKSSEQAITARHINFQRAKLRYFYKYHGWLTAWLLRLFILWNYGWQLTVEAIKGIVGHKRPLRWQRVQAYWQIIRSGLRPAGH
jgi:N-acetylglucosaminyl-diphospho-decaprenol L-rhamnosyltransferase